MSRSEISTEFNTFVGGILTEANPINFPPGFSIDEENFILERNGTRRRRPGLALDASAIDFDTTVLNSMPQVAGQTRFAEFAEYLLWKNADVAGVRRDLLILFYRTSRGPTIPADPLRRDKFTFIAYTLEDSTDISNNLLATDEIPGGYFNKASVYKSGIITTYGDLSPSQGIVNRFLTLDGSSFAGTTTSEAHIKIRDFNGVAGSALGQRFNTLSDNHAYNLFNNGWTKVDVDAWKTAEGTYPSISDSPVYSREKGSSFDTTILDNALFGNSRAPAGHSIIRPWYPYLEFDSGSSTITGSATSDDPDFGQILGGEGRGSVIDSTFFAGRWLGLCQSGKLLANGSTFLLYSQSASLPDAYSTCHQSNDPTSSYLNQIIETDGGLVDISSIGRPARLISSRSRLVAFGDTGVVEVSSTGNAFTPLGIDIKEISKNTIANDSMESTYRSGLNHLTETNIVTANSPVTVEDSFFYWSTAGIITLTYDTSSLQYVETNLSDPTIQTLYNSIPDRCKAFATGLYVPEESSLMWLYSEDAANPDKFTKALCYDLVLKAWFKFSFFSDNDNYIRGAFLVPTTADVVGRSDKFSRVTFLVQAGLVFTTAYFKADGFDDIAGEEQAFIQTGYLNANDSSKYKQGTYIVPSFLRTEDGFTDDGSGNLTANNESSCTVSAWWDYAEEDTNTKVNPPFEAYRLNKVYIPTGPADTFDYGQSVITTKNRLTGRGRALSLRFETSIGKDCRLLGWNLGFGAVGKV